MKIKKMILHNFRAYKHAVIEFDGFTCIIGQNDVGKSTIFVALDWFFGNRELEETDFHIDSINNNSIFQDSNILYVEIYFDANDDNCIPTFLSNGIDNHFFSKDFIDRNNCFCLKKTAERPFSAEQSVYSVRAYSFVEIGDIFSNIPMDTLKNMHSEISEENYTSFFHKLKGKQESESLLIDDICDDLYNYYVKKSSQNTTYITLNSDVIIQSISSWLKLQKTEASVYDYINLLVQAHPNYKTICEELNEIKKDVVSAISTLSYDDVTLNGSVEISVKGVLSTKQGIPLQNRGEGFQMTIKNAILKKLAQQQKEGTSFIFAVDEVETHLHPNMQRVIFETLKSLSEKHQVILTTNSPFIVKESAQKGVRLTILKQINGSTKCVRFPWSNVSQDAINYFAFDEASTGFHIELFSTMHRLINEKCNGVLSLERIDDFLKSNYKTNLCVEKFYRISKNEEPIIRNDKETLPEKRFVSHECSLPYCVRNQINHPHPINKKFDSLELVRKSIDYMIDVITDLQSAG